MRRSFNDNFYCKTIQEWETKTIPDRLVSDRFTWGFRLLPITLVIGIAAGLSWRLWIALLAVTYLFVILFCFFEETNENLRFVRHQMRAFREGVHCVNKQVNTCRDQSKNFTLYDAIESLDRERENPMPEARPQ